IQIPARIKYHHFHFLSGDSPPLCLLAAAICFIRVAAPSRPDITTTPPCGDCGGGGAEEGKLCAIISFAAAVPSAPQMGQAMVEGMRPLTGSTSKAYFWPQTHETFIGIIGYPSDRE